MCRIYGVYIVIIIACTSLLPGCTTTKNTSATRNYQAFITQYNVHYNGDRHYNETLEDMERNYKDDFSRMLFVFPAEARAVPDAPQPEGDFSRSIEKARKAIQLHSIKNKPTGPSSSPQQREWKRRKEYNPFLHNSWLLMGRAEYMNGNFSTAANTFQYISRNFKWLPHVVADSKTWEALCYCALGRLHEAEMTLDNVDTTRINSDEARRVFLAATSSLKLRQEHYDEALTSLTQLLNLSKKDYRKSRIRFLLAQTLEKCGQNNEAYLHYKKVCDNMRADPRLRFNARMAMSRITPVINREKEIEKLKHLTGYGSNTGYLDQIHYAIGNLYLIQSDTLQAKGQYIEAIKKSTRKGHEQATARLALGEIYYSESLYHRAAECFNMALPMLPSYHPRLDSLRRRAILLSRLSPHAADVQFHDSLIAMSRLSKHEQIISASKLAHELINYQYNRNSIPHNPPTGTKHNNSAAWYFYNPELVKTGKARFMEQWKNRGNIDNWRVKTMSDPHHGIEHDSTTANVTHNATLDKDTPAVDDTVAKILSEIPDTPQKLEIIETRIADGLYNMGLILRNEFNDYSAAAKAWNELAARFPESDHITEVLESLYLMYLHDGKSESAENIKTTILSALAGSDLAEAIKDHEYIDRRKRLISSRQAIYEQVYKAYLNNDNETVHRLCAVEISAAPASDLTPHFRYLNALAYAADGDKELFRKEITSLANDFPDNNLARVSQGMLELLESGRELYSGHGNVLPLRHNPVNSEDRDIDDRNPQCLDSLFTMNAQSPHIVLIVYDKNSTNANILLFNIARHNFNTFAIKDFSLSKSDLCDTSAIRIDGFANANEAARYISLLEKSILAPELEHAPLMISEEDYNTLTARNLTIASYLHTIENHSDIETLKRVLDPD